MSEGVEAVRNGAGVILRHDLAQLVMYGRDPVRMLQGLITNDLAGAPTGRAVYGVMLTAKGRCVADLRLLTAGDEVWIDLPRETLEAALDHLRRFVPPMYARWREVSDQVGMLGVYGPRARALLQTALGAPVSDLGEDQVQREPVTLIGSRYAGEAGFDVRAEHARLEQLHSALVAAGARPITAETLETLRIQAGRPRGGHELTADTIPTEAFESTGLMERAISFTKGCYTGQEVIVRIAHRGHVNRHLRRLKGRAEPGTRLYADGKDVGWVTSVAPELPLALGFVRREVSGAVRAGAADGPELGLL